MSQDLCRTEETVQSPTLGFAAVLGSSMQPLLAMEEVDYDIQRIYCSKNYIWSSVTEVFKHFAL